MEFTRQKDSIIAIYSSCKTYGICSSASKLMVIIISSSSLCILGQFIYNIKCTYMVLIRWKFHASNISNLIISPSNSIDKVLVHTSIFVLAIFKNGLPNSIGTSVEALPVSKEISRKYQFIYFN